MALRRGNQAVKSNLPFLEPAVAEPCVPKGPGMPSGTVHHLGNRVAGPRLSLDQIKQLIAELEVPLIRG